jgi:phospholipase B1
VETLKSSTEVDYLNEWKLITFFVGGNDLCYSCQDKDFYSPEKYVASLKQVLDIFHAELPKTFVNLVVVLDITNLREVNGGAICAFLHETKECPCGVNATQQDYLKDLVKKYQDGTDELVQSGQYDDRDDFTVVVQPLLKNFQPPRRPDHSIDQSYLAPDCFHFSPKGHGK